mgnify:CR=1 FL=1
MATKFPFEEFTRVVWVNDPPGIANIAAPTLLELNHPETVDLSCLLTTDGLALGVGTNAVSGSQLCSRLDSQVPGKVTFSPSLTGFRYNDEDDDDLWYLATWALTGYLVVRRGRPHDQAWASGAPVEVYKAQLGEPGMANSAGDTMQTFSVPLFFDDFDQKAFVGGTS